MMKTTAGDYVPRTRDAGAPNSGAPVQVFTDGAERGWSRSSNKAVRWLVAAAAIGLAGCRTPDLEADRRLGIVVPQDWQPGLERNGYISLQGKAIIGILARAPWPNSRPTPVR